MSLCVIRYTPRKLDQHSANLANEQVSFSNTSTPTAVPHSKDIRNALMPASTDEVNTAVCDFFYGDIIPFNVAASPRFQAMVKAIKSAPADYKAPSPWQLRYPLLEKRDQELHDAVDMHSDYLTGVGVTFCSDGWEDVEHNHMINFLYCSPRGTVTMGTGDYTHVKSHDAKFIFEEMKAKITELGPRHVVAVTTDTCSTMKAAWALLEKEFTHVTCGGCGPHVLNLLIKDICDIDAVSTIVADVEYVSKWFTNKKWKGINLRKRLLKKHSINHLKKSVKCKTLCLTRFASVVALMERLIKLKDVLQSVVMDPEWKNADFHNEIADDVSPKIRSDTWWGEMDAFLQVLLPVKKLLKFTDGDKPTCSKMYNGMFQLGRQIAKAQVSWANKAKDCFDERWEYIHTPLHAAGYALDPEFLDNTSLDGWVMDGVYEMCEKMALLSVSNKTCTPIEELCLEDTKMVEFISKAHAQFQDFRDQNGPVFRKPAVVANRRKVSAYKWWQMYCNHMPELQSVAVRVLSQVAAASICERNWSIHGMVHNKRRTRLNPKRAIQLVFIHQTLRLMNSLNDPTWEEDLAPWHEGEVSSDDPGLSSRDEASESD